MVAKRIDVVISKDGSVSIEAHGYVGEACEEATRDLEKALGMQRPVREFKMERYQEEISESQKEYKT